MTMYMFYMKQSGEGCDYTIGCAQKAVFFEAANDVEALEKAKKILTDHGFLGLGIYSQLRDDLDLYVLVNLNLGKVEVPFLDWLHAEQEVAKQQELEEQRKKDEKQFEELKKKLGK